MTSIIDTFMEEEHDTIKTLKSILNNVSIYLLLMVNLKKNI